MDYLDCANQALFINDFKLKGHNGNIANLQQNHISLSIIFALKKKVADA